MILHVLIATLGLAALLELPTLSEPPSPSVDVSAVAKAIDTRDVPRLRELLKGVTDPGAIKLGNLHLLSIACQDGTSALVEELLERGAPIDGYADAEFGQPLFCAMASRHPQIVQLLLSRGAAIPSRPGYYEPGAFEIAFGVGFSHEHDEIIGMLRDAMLARGVTHGRSPKATCDLVDEALIAAVAMNRRDWVDQFLADGANVNAALPNRATPLSAATDTGSMDMIDFLLARGASPRFGSDGFDWLDSAVRSPHATPAILTKIIELHGNSKELNDPSAHYIQTAVDLASADVIRFIIERAGGVSALHEPTRLFGGAVWMGHPDAVRGLLAAGLTPRLSNDPRPSWCRDEDRTSDLDIAKKRLAQDEYHYHQAELKEVVRLLEEAEAKMRAESSPAAVPGDAAK